MSIYLSQLGVFELQYQLKRVPKWYQVTINTDGINRTPLFVKTCCSVTIVNLNIVFWVEWPNGAHFFSIVVFNDSYLRVNLYGTSVCHHLLMLCLHFQQQKIFVILFIIILFSLYQGLVLTFTPWYTEKRLLLYLFCPKLEHWYCCILYIFQSLL